MDVQIKKAIRAGNSSAVLLPRAWLNKEVRVELAKKTLDVILIETLSIIGKHIKLDMIIGSYLVGSYARGDEDYESDIDVLVITKDIDKPMIHEGIYNILIVSSELLKQKLKTDLLPVGQMIKEAVPLLNSDYIKSTEVKVTKGNTLWYIQTTKDKLSIIAEIISDFKNRGVLYVPDKLIYTLILRIRTLYVIDRLIKDKKYSKKDFVKMIELISGSEKAYLRYLALKNDLDEKSIVSLEEAEKLFLYLKNQLLKVKKLI